MEKINTILKDAEKEILEITFQEKRLLTKTQLLEQKEKLTKIISEIDENLKLFANEK